MSLFADQLMYEKKVTTAIRKTISLKTRGRVMGLTQYLDPLNIAKVMTLGSSLGPALLGHWMGRDPRDIQYFTGRFKPIRERTGEKITKLSKGAGNIEGVSDVLRKMYKLLSGTHEQNVKRLELNNNLEEERRIEEERRHKELLDVLSNLGTGKKKHSKLKDAGDFLSNLWKMLKPLIAAMVAKAVETAMKAYAWLKDFYKWMKESGKFKDFFARAKPWLKLGVGLELALHSGDVGAGSDIVPNADINSPEKKYDAWSMVLRGEAKNTDEAFQKIREAKNYAPPDRNEIEQAAHADDLTEPQRKKLYGATKSEMREWLKIHLDPASTFDVADVKNAPTKKTQSKPDTQSVATPPLAQNAPVEAKARDVKLQTAQNEHTSGRIATGVLVRQSKTTVNKNTVNKNANNKSIPLKNKVPAVRNEETEFRNRMFDNTVLMH